MPDLVCDDNVGAAFNMAAGTDVCVPSACATRTLYATDYCTSSCPCGIGGGDCDSDAECMPDLKCGADIGAAYGQDPTWDICIPK